MEAQIKANAELVRSVARNSLGVEIAYDEAGVTWLDGYINEQREIATPDVKDRLPNTLGAFLGECIRHSFGGQWIQDPDGGWTVKISGELSIFPFNKVRKQLTNATEDSVLAFYKTIPPLLAHAAKGAPKADGVDGIAGRRWWKFW